MITSKKQSPFIKYIQNYRNIYIVSKIKLIVYKIRSGDRMINKNANIWIWLQNGRIMKAISCVDDGTIKIYDENDNLILKRTGLNKFQVKQIEKTIIEYGAKKLDKHAEPFKFFR